MLHPRSSIALHIYPQSMSAYITSRPEPCKPSHEVFHLIPILDTIPCRKISRLFRIPSLLWAATRNYSSEESTPKQDCTGILLFARVLTTFDCISKGHEQFISVGGRSGNGQSDVGAIHQGCLAAYVVQLQTIEPIVDDSGDWHSLLEEMRTMIHAKKLQADRDAPLAVSTGLQLKHRQLSRAVWLEQEVQQFIYGEGQNPFSERSPLDISQGVGIQRGAFDPDFERPNVVEKGWQRWECSIRN